MYFAKQNTPLPQRQGGTCTKTCSEDKYLLLGLLGRAYGKNPPAVFGTLKNYTTLCVGVSSIFHGVCQGFLTLLGENLRSKPYNTDPPHSLIQTHMICFRHRISQRRQPSHVIIHSIAHTTISYHTENGGNSMLCCEPCNRWIRCRHCGCWNRSSCCCPRPCCCRSCCRPLWRSC